jgi:hypothetical protein
MLFRIGLLFISPLSERFNSRPVASLLQEIDERTKSVRGGEAVTLVPFVRTNREAALSLDVAGSAYSVEATTWGEGGVLYRPLQALGSLQHLPLEPKLDFDRGMRAILSVGHVVVIVCASSVGFDEVASMAESFQNAWALLALVSLEDNKRHFLKIDPNVAMVDSTDWFLGVKKRWQTAKPDVRELPPVKKAALGLLFPYLASAIIRRRFENVKRRPRSEVESCREGMGISESAAEKLRPEDQALLHHNLQLQCPFFARHDDLGRYYSNVFRTTCLVIPLLIAASTVLAVAAVIDVEQHRLYWHVVEGLLLVIAAVLFLRSKLLDHHSKWVEHRLTAELMRSSVLCNLLQTVPELACPSEEKERWVSQTQVVWTYLRSLPALAFSTPGADLLSARRSAIADYTNFQERFHTDFGEQHYVAQTWLTKISGRAFFATLCLVGVQLTIAVLSPDRKDWPVTLMMVTLVCALSAFVLSLLAHQLGFEAIAERSTNASHHFRDLRTAIDQAAHSADARLVYAWAHECAQVVLAEQHSWYRHIPLIRMHL